MPNAAAWPGLFNAVMEVQPNGTLDQAQTLGDLTMAQQLQVVGKIGNGPAGAADVDWYSFTLDSPTRVTVTTLDGQAHGSFISELSLYNADADPGDPYLPAGYRLLGQDDGANHGGDARIDRSLAPGTYYVAVSGSGNQYFHPDIAGSGIPGSTGAYGLSITGQDLGLGAANGPVVLATDLLTYAGFTPPGGITPVSNAVIGRSPFIIRVDLSEPLDPSTVNGGQTVQLTDITTGQSISVTAYFDAAANEIKVFSAAPLAPDEYQLLLSGDNSTGAAVVQDLAGNPLGAGPLNPSGRDYAFTFQVTGSEGIASTSAGSDGAPATAHDLGDITRASLVQWLGAIGDDPSDATPFNPADVDIYHFHISGPGNFAFRAEIFAGRIGSPLNSEASLFRLNPADGKLYLIGLNDNTGNDTATFDGIQRPLQTDSGFTMGLTAGDYYVAVTGSGYVPATLTDAGLPGPASVFDPTALHPFGGFTTGDYVLNLSVLADNTPPKVTSVALASNAPLVNGAILSAPPAVFTVHFSEPVNLAQAALQAFQQTGDVKLDSVFIVGLNGTFYPRFSAETAGGAVATFKMYDALPNGVYQLHLSGPRGLTDGAGNLLAGNSAGGDYVISFTVQGPARGSPGDPLTWVVQDQRNLGVLFPLELQQGVTLQRPPLQITASLPAGNEAYQFQGLQDKRYTFLVSGASLPPGMRITITDVSGNPEPARTFKTLQVITVRAVLKTGSYIIHVSGWSATAGFSIKIIIDSALEPAPPLTVGPGPAVPLRSLTDVPPPPPVVAPPTPPVVVPPINLVSISTPPGNIPSEVLLGLGAGQLGGISGANALALETRFDVYDHLVALGPDPAFAQLVVQLPILLQVQNSGKQDDTDVAEKTTRATAAASMLQEVMHALSHLDWQTVAEFLQRVEDWTMEKMTPTPRTGAEAIPDSDVPPGFDMPEDSFWPNTKDSASPFDAGTQALSFAAALAVVGPRKPRSARKLLLRRPSVDGSWSEN